MTWITVTPKQFGQISGAYGAALGSFFVRVGSPAQAVAVPTGIDFLLFQTADGGEITIEGGIVTRTNTPETAVYLSLFGGRDYWANLDENDPEYKYRAETGAVLDELVPTSSNLKRLNDAIIRDLAWLGADVVVRTALPAIGRVSIEVDISPGQTIKFEENWSAIK